MANARHYGILRSKGEYITTLDSDDYLIDKRKLETEMSLIKKMESSDKNIIAYSNIVHVNENGSPDRVIFNNSNVVEGNVLYSIITRSKPIPRDFIMKRDIYFEIGCYDTSLPIYEDWDLKIRLASMCEYHFSGLDGIAYRQHNDGLSSAPHKKHLSYLKKVFLKNRFILNKNEKNPATLHFFLFMTFFWLKHGIKNASKKIGIYTIVKTIKKKVEKND